MNKKMKSFLQLVGPLEEIFWMFPLFEGKSELGLGLGFLLWLEICSKSFW